MIHAYNNIYVTDAQRFLAHAFDYAITDCKLDADTFGYIFASSNIAKEMERGNPSIISGMGGEEATIQILKGVNQSIILPDIFFSQSKTPAYWAGWALAYYQWFTARSFKDIFRHLPLSMIIEMYNPYHEIDLVLFVEELENRYKSVVLDTKLKMIREARGVSQRKLAEISGVAKRSIQLYEQRVNDIDKAQAQTIYKLSRVLGCEIEDLLENPQN